jgi:hypothetical protein
MTFTPAYKEHTYENQQPFKKDRNNSTEITPHAISGHSNRTSISDTDSLANDGYSRIKEYKKDDKTQNIFQNNILSIKHEPDPVQQNYTYAKPNTCKQKKTDNLSANLQMQVNDLYAKPMKKKDKSTQSSED